MLGTKTTLMSLARDLAKGHVTSVALTHHYLDRIQDPGGEGGRSFIRVYETQALQEAAVADLQRARGNTPSPLAGIPVSVKDLFDIAGDVTTAGSIALKGSAPAKSDALIIQRLRAAGAVVIGRSNMTEFAYSVLGLNPHYGTPKNPHDGARIPGGSSSGAATAVAYGCCAASIGTDTAGSVRVPAAFCGLVGFKPTQSRVPRAGTFALAPSLDSIGPIAQSVACCALLDSIMAGETPRPIPELSMRGLKLGVPARGWCEGLDPGVGRAYERALSRLSAAGAQLVAVDLAAIGILEQVDQLGGLIGPEAFATHRALLPKHGSYDPRVRSRIEASAGASAADYIDAVRLRTSAIEVFNQATAALDAVIAPTVALVPPRFDEVAQEQDYRRVNSAIRRIAAAVNLLDRCAVSLPCHQGGELPVGLMIVGEHNADAQLQAIAASIERALSFAA